nr:MAG TPA: hypothetical protein [Caudoviricetes sp.]DAS89056.1 MAG TPA: hypothetical protein [Caudoviricetes sp.]
MEYKKKLKARKCRSTKRAIKKIKNKSNLILAYLTKSVK